MNTKPKFTIPPDPLNFPDTFTEEEMAEARARVHEREKAPAWVDDLMEMRAKQQAEAKAQADKKE